MTATNNKEKMTAGHAAAYLTCLAGIFIGLGFWFLSRGAPVISATCYRYNGSVYIKQILKTNEALTCILDSDIYAECAANATEGTFPDTYQSCREKYLGGNKVEGAIASFVCAGIFGLAMLIAALIFCVDYCLTSTRPKTPDELKLEEAKARKPYIPNEDA